MRYKLSKLVSQDLALRDSADLLFKYLASKREQTITIDFSDIKSMTRSFAHQYLIDKRKFRKAIIETNIPAAIKQMFAVANTPIEATSFSKRRASLSYLAL